MCIIVIINTSLYGDVKMKYLNIGYFLCALITGVTQSNVTYFFLFPSANFSSTFHPHLLILQQLCLYPNAKSTWTSLKVYSLNFLA
jgi:hypothetical protein